MKYRTKDWDYLHSKTFCKKHHLMNISCSSPTLQLQRSVFCLYRNMFSHVLISDSKSVKNTVNDLIYLYINLVCLSVCLYPINVKTAEPIGPNFFVGHLGTPGKVYESSKFQIFVSIKIRSSLIFKNFENSAKFFVKIRELFLLCFTMYTKRTCSELI